MNDAVWAPVRGYEGFYEVSNKGGLRRIKLGFKLTFHQVQEILRLRESDGLSAGVLAKSFGVTKHNIEIIFNKAQWKHAAPYRAIKQTRNTHGYPSARICKEGKCQTVVIHRLVADAFLGPIPAGIEVNHKNGIKHDNDIQNLELVTSGENTRHAVDVLGRKLGKSRPGSSNPISKLTEESVLSIRARASVGESQAAIAREYGVTKEAVHAIVKRINWRHI